MTEAWVDADNVSLLADLYELTMLQAYHRNGMREDAVFTLSVRRLPENRNLLLACGLETVLDYLENLHFERQDIEYLRALDLFDEDFLDHLRRFRFTGEVRALPEGTPFFALEPVLEIKAPIGQAQFVETFVMNQIHFQSLAASKALRVVRAASPASVVDFGLRRMHGADAGIKAARAFHIAGVASTSNVLAGRLYGIPVSGTMAHSYIQAHAEELAAFRSFARTFPETILLVDTFEPLEGVRNVIRLSREWGDGFGVAGIRLDSGDILALSRASRTLLDEAGLGNLKIVASGGMDEHRIRYLLDQGAPIDAFGVGTGMGVSDDCPSLDMVYKLTNYAGRPVIKTSPGKSTLPGPMQLFRRDDQGEEAGDIIGLDGENQPGRPLLRTVMRAGRRLPEVSPSLRDIRLHATSCMERLPERLLRLAPADPPYPVIMSHAMQKRKTQLATQTVRN